MKKLLLVYFMFLAGITQGQDMFQKELFSADLVMENRDKLKLTDAQANKIKKIHAENAGEFSTLKWDLDEETKKLNKLLEEDRPNQVEVQKQMDRVLALESSLKKKRLGTLVAIKNELDKDQVEYLKSKNRVVVGSYFYQKDGQAAKVINGKVTGLTSSSSTSSTIFPDSENNKVMIRVNSDKSGNQPLFVIDGKVVENGKKDLSDLDPKDIESISVLKDNSATEAYGEKGKDGVIVITLKKKKKN